MNFKASILVIALAVSAAFAQTTTQSPDTVALSVKPAKVSPAANAAVSAAPIAKAPAIMLPAKPASAIKVVRIKDNPVSVAADGTTSASRKGRRDPFVSPVSDRVKSVGGCSIGKKCLVPDQIQLQGVVKGPNGMIALIVNSAQKAYFMRENDPVFNGYVVKITSDSIIFKETTSDRLGKPVTREIVKKVSAPVV